MTAATNRAVQQAPCAKCPFRARFKGDDDYLRPGRRAQIVRSLLEGADFACHETTTVDPDDESTSIVTPDSVSCAGAWLTMFRDGHEPQMARISERLGLVNLDDLNDRNAAVELWTVAECLYELEDPDEVETCNTVGPHCIAPAGYMTGSGVVRGTESADQECPSCGEAVCSECADADTGHCGYCVEQLAEW